MANETNGAAPDVERLKAEMPAWREQVEKRMAIVREAAARLQRRAAAKRA